MTEKLNIISIYCEVSCNFLDCSEKTDFKQIVLKNHINGLFNIAFKHIGNTNRIILVTNNVAAIAYTGAAEGAMLVATDILSGTLIANEQGSAPLTARIGIHLEPVHLVTDFNDRPNIIGNGIDAAKQMMSKAKPDEILVSRSYYESISPSIQVFLTLFHDPNIECDHHVRQYQTYLINLNKDQISKSQPLTIDRSLTSTPNLASSEKTEFLNASNWKYVLLSLFILGVLISTVKLVSSAKLAIAPSKTPNQNVETLPIEASKSSITNAPNIKSLAEKTEMAPEESNVYGKNNGSLPQELKPIEPLKATTSSKPVKRIKKQVKQETKSRMDDNLKKSNTQQTISWETLKNSIMQGKKNECTQPQIAMNQCH